MRVDFPYPGYEEISPCEVPDRNCLGVFAPKAWPQVNEERVMVEAFQSPIAAPRLSEAVRGKKNVLILIDDGTRETPVARMLPHIIAELHTGGIADDAIEFLQAPGTHRPMRKDELQKKLGNYFSNYVVHEHHYLDQKSLHEFGYTRDGTRVTANKLLHERDFILGVGSIVPHRVKGLSGGAKIAFPGVAGKEMMERNQWEASMHMSETVMGLPENPMRLRMEEAAQLAGLSYIVNAVYDIEKRIVGCFVGDVVQAHRQGCRVSCEVYGAHLPKRADIVLIDSHSADRDFWQSAKGPYAATMAVRDGGSLILVSPNPEGVASNHKNLLEIGYRPHTKIVEMVQNGKIDDLVGVAILADVCQIVDKTDCIMVSPGVKKAEAEKIGFRYANTAQDALRMAFERQGKEAQVAVLKYGGHILPIIDSEASGR